MLREKKELHPSSSITAPNPEADTLTKHAPKCFALILVWSAREPHRVGEAALLTLDESAWILGRSPERSNMLESGRSTRTPPGSRSTPAEITGQPLLFFRQRPAGVFDSGSPDTAPRELGGEAISRRQLLLSPVGAGALVQNIGQCELAVNGKVVREATLRPGDTLHLKNQLLLYCTQRPLELPPLKAYSPSRVSAFGKPDQDGMVGESPVMWKLRERIAACARTKFHVLVVGDSGSGKELVAQAIHQLSQRASRKLIADNIAAIPPGLAAALLFGNKKNFPNPGMEERVGLIGAANGSSLFLDEIGDMPEDVQPMFLRVTERNGEYIRLGEESRLHRSDYRLIGATNRPEKMRYELKRRFQREIRVPGLNQRKEDIPLLIQHLLRAQASDDDMDVARFLVDGYARVHPLLVEQLIHHTYKTHISEISFLLGQAMAESDHDMIRPIGVGLQVAVPNTPETPLAAPQRAVRPLPTVEAVRTALAQSRGNVILTASALDISRHQLNRLIQREGLAVPRVKRGVRREPDPSQT